jgi:hypothetical protein
MSIRNVKSLVCSVFGSRCEGSTTTSLIRSKSKFKLIRSVSNPQKQTKASDFNFFGNEKHFYAEWVKRHILS